MAKKKMSEGLEKALKKLVDRLVERMEDASKSASPIPITDCFFSIVIFILRMLEMLLDFCCKEGVS